MLKKKERDTTDDELARLATQSIQKPMPPEKTKELLNEAGSNWVYGQGMGETALTIGTIVAFPPYAIYVLGNAALSLSGYEPLHVTDALPEKERKGWNGVYDGVTEAPGRVAAAIAGEKFRTEDDAKARLKVVLEEP